MATPVFDVILGKFRDALAGATTVGAALYQSASAAVACRAIGRGVIVDYTVPSQATLVSPVASQSGSDLLITITGTAPANGTILRARAGTGSLPGNLSAYDPYAGPIYWVVSSSGSTFKLSLTKGGAAIAYSSAGTAGWTLTQEDYEEFTISTDVNSAALSIANGARFMMNLFSGTGGGYNTGAGQAIPYLRFNGDTGSKYSFSTTEATNIFTSNAVCGNVLQSISYQMAINGSACSGFMVGNGKWGTSPTQANSTPVVQTPVAVCYDAESGTLAITSITFGAHVSTGFLLKAGTRVKVTQVSE